MGRTVVSASRREFYEIQSRCYGRRAAILATSVRHPEFSASDEWNAHDLARIAGHFGLLALRKPCGCDEDDPMCLHGLPAIIGSCEEFPITWRSDYLGIDRSQVVLKPQK